MHLSILQTLECIRTAVENTPLKVIKLSQVSELIELITNAESDMKEGRYFLAAKVRRKCTQEKIVSAHHSFVYSGHRRNYFGAIDDEGRQKSHSDRKEVRYGQQ
jgi:hypothetical protein